MHAIAGKAAIERNQRAEHRITQKAKTTGSVSRKSKVRFLHKDGKGELLSAKSDLPNIVVRYESDKEFSVGLTGRISGPVSGSKYVRRVSLLVGCIGSGPLQSIPSFDVNPIEEQ